MGGKERLLFGTAFSIILPEDVKDASAVRQIPDNQEVFCHPVTDQSFIIELLEYQEGGDEVALRTHFDDLASSNNATDESEILRTEEIRVSETNMGESSSVWHLDGRQKISKFNESAKNIVNIHLGLIRLENHKTDIVITMNDPVCLSPSSSSYSVIPVSTQQWQVEDFLTALKSINLLDAGIFSN